MLLDAVCDITGVPEAFSGMPPDSRAMEIWTHRVDSLFLDTFGRPDPNQDPPCERATDTTVVQALHLMNAPNLHRKVTQRRRPRRQAGGQRQTAAEQSSRSCTCCVYSRFPTADEQQAVAEAVRRRAPIAGRRPKTCCGRC